MVRVGLYETIPGYSITEINFYKAGGSKAEAVNNIILTSGTENYFVGGSDVKGTITYNWTGTTPSYTYTYDDTNLTKTQNWYAGKFEPHNALATVSTAAVAELYGKDNDMSTNGYFTVIPTPSATTAAPILIKCDYTLTSDDHSGETIKVTGATAAILQHSANGKQTLAIHTFSRFHRTLMAIQVMILTKRVSTLSLSMQL